MKYKKKPVVIEAFRLGWHPVPEWFYFAVINGTIIDNMDSVTIKTLEGEMRACDGDFIIRGIAGEIYPCKAEIFAATYEEA